jgi:hypothetical protein
VWRGPYHLARELIQTGLVDEFYFWFHPRIQGPSGRPYEAATVPVMKRVVELCAQHRGSDSDDQRDGRASAGADRRRAPRQCRRWAAQHRVDAPEEVTGRCSSFSRSEATAKRDGRAACRLGTPSPTRALSPILKVARKSRRRSIGRRS